MASRRPRGRSRRRPRRRLPTSFKLPTLDQGQWDLVGLGLVSFAAFFACVFYLGWAGGEVGEAMADGIRLLFGGAGYLAPLALFAGGAIVMLRPMLPAVRPWGVGALCLGGALTLGLAAGSLGLGPGDTPRDGFLDAELPEATRRARGRIPLLGVEPSLLACRRSHPVRVPAAGRRAAAHRRLGGRCGQRHAPGRGQHHRAGARVQAGAGERSVGAHHGAARADPGRVGGAA